MSRDKARLRDDGDAEERRESGQYYGPAGERTSAPSPIPRRSYPPGSRPTQPRRQPPRRPQRPYQPQQLSKQRSVWPWLLIGCAGGIVILVVAAAITVLLTLRSATGGNIPIPGLPAPSDYTQQSQQTVQLSSVTQVQIHNQIGNVTVTVDPNATVSTVTTLKKVKATSSDEANKEFGNISVQVQPAGTPVGTLHVDATVPDTGTIFSSHKDSVDLTITLPAQSTTPIGTGTSPTPTVAGVTPPTLNVDLTIGNVKVNGLSGVVILKDSVGDITLDSVMLFDSSHLQTGTGNVTFKGNVNPTPKVSNVTPRYKLQSETGDINVTLPAGTDIILDANTNSGTITSDFPITIKSSNGAANFYGPLLAGSSFDSTKAVLTLNVGTGNVTLHKT